MNNSNQYQPFQEEDNPHPQEIDIKIEKKKMLRISMDTKIRKQKQQKKEDQEQNQNSSSDSEKDVEEEEQRILLEEIKKKKKNKSHDNRPESLQLRQLKLEYSNVKALQSANRLRSCARIFFLIIIATLLVTGFYIIYDSYAFYEGMEEINENSNIFLNITNCRLNIIDTLMDTQFKNNGKNLNRDVSMLSKHRQHVNHDDEIPNESNPNKKQPQNNANFPNILLTYFIPGRFNVDPQASKSEVFQEKNGQDYTYTFKNVLSAQNCVIDIHVLKITAINNLIVNCFETCYMMISSTNITFNNLNITGDLVEVNVPFLVSQNLSFQSIQGRFQGGFLDFQQYADIRLETGDIIVQTDKEMMVNWTHSNPHYCYSSPVIANPVVIGCQQPPQSEIDAFLTGVGTGKNENTKIKKDTNQTEKENNKQNKNGTEEPEYFYEESDATVILLPFMDTYNKSKKFKENLGFLQESEDNQENNVTDTNNTKKENSKKKANMHSKRKEKQEKNELLFQPSCFGNSVFCTTPNCTTIQDALSKINGSLSTDNTTTQASNTTGQRYLTGNRSKQHNKINQTNQTQINYKGLKEEAYDSLPHIIPQGIRFLNLTGRFGNIYVNVISKPNNTVNQKDTIIHGISYTQENIEFDLPSQKKLRTHFEMASDPHVFDPNFVLEIGSKNTQSDNFQQWQITYNPAYSYLRPWWIGIFSFTLMSTASWDLQLNLGHGYCPYMPNLNLNDIYRANFLVEKYFESAENSIKTIAWQNSVNFPSTENIAVTNGVRQVINSNDEYERWVQIAKINETSYDLTTINLNESPATQWAVYVSVLISVLMAAILIVGVLYIINSVYKQIIEWVAQTSKYSSIEKSKDIGDHQPLMKDAPEITHEIDDNYNYVVDNNIIDEDSDDEIEIILNFNPARLFYQLFLLAPPLSAFIDYLFVLITKKYINSANEFYTHLFEKQGNSDNEQELHNLTTESIAGNEMKTLYEKFCFLNGFLEQKLDDEKNFKLLKQKGFHIILKQDTQSESYVRVLFTGIITKLPAIPQTKKPLALFIESCCKISKFEEDNIVVTTFNENFQEFCTLNHLQFESPSAAELQKNYNIESKYIPQKWVERIQSKLVNQQEDEQMSACKKILNCFKKCYQKCRPKKQIYIINRQKMQNHYFLIMNQPEKIKTQGESELANSELILFGGWWLADFITVWAHIITTIILIIPLFGFTLFEKILYAQYSLISGSYLITLEDITTNFWILPIKLYNESAWIKNILILIAIYWVYSIIDLIYYYLSMEFPQENFFKKVTYKMTNRIQLIFRQGMWALVLFSAYQLCFFFTLSLVWLLLGAIVNPVAFLPYATAAATFITVISTKASQFREIATEGFETVIEYVENIAKGQMNNMLGNMDFKGKTNDVLNSDAFRSITEQAVNFGLIDQETLNHLEENTETILNNPEKALENASEELAEICQNPGAFVANLTKQLESKAESIIREQMAKQIDGFGEQLADSTIALYKKDKYQFKNTMTQLMFAAAKEQKMDSLMKMGPPIMNFIWEFAYPNDSNVKSTSKDYLDQLIGPCTDCITGLITQEIQNIPKEQIDYAKILQIIVRKAISLANNLQHDNISGIFNDFEEIIQSLKEEPWFFQIKHLSRYSGLLKIALSLFEERKGGELIFHKIFNIVSGFFDDIPELRELKDLLGMVELLVNSFRQQNKVLPAKSIKLKIQKGLSVLYYEGKNRNLQFSGKNKLLENASFISMIFNYIQHNFVNIPKDQFKDIFKYSFEETRDCQEISKLVKSEKEYQKLIKLMTGIFEMVALFMEDPKEIVANQYLSASAFAIDQKKAYYIQRVASLKYLKSITYEGSETEDEFFESLSTNPLIINLALHLRLDTNIIRGIIAQLIFSPNRYGLQDLYLSISKLNKCDIKRVRQFFSILTLFNSQNENHLFNAVVELSIPKEYFILILISKQIINPDYIDVENLIALGTQQQTIKMLKNNDFDHTLWIQQLKQDITKEDDGLVNGGNSIKMKQLLLEQISVSNFQITILKVQSILLALGNNLNEFATLSQNDIDLLANILTLKNIDLINAYTLTSDIRQGIYTFAQILNINKIHFEDLINIVFLTNSEKVVQSIQNSQQLDNPFIEPNTIQDYENYTQFLFSKMELIQKRNNFITQKFKILFPKFNLPQTLIIKLLLNKESKIDINALYQLAYLQFDKDEYGKVPSGTLKQLNNSISFMTSTLNFSNIEQIRQQLSKQDLTEGQGLIIQMLNENSKKRGLTIFLNYLFDNSKRNQNDGLRTLPQVYHLFACLYLYFTGQASDIMIKQTDPVTKQEQQISIIQYLSIKLDIKSEFFEALHTFYLQDNQKFTSVMVKFMRRQQACKFEQQYPGIKIPLQSLVKIPDQFVLNFINLIQGIGYQTSFFSKQLGLDSDVVLFISILMNIKNAQNANARRMEYSYFNNNSQKLGQLLTKVQVKSEEFILLLNLIFQDYDIHKLQYMIDGLNMQQKLKVANLGALLQLDQVINIDLLSNEYFNTLSAQIKENTLVKKMKMDPQIIMMVKGLTRGGFGCIQQYVQILPHLDYTECPGKSEYFGLLQGLIGSISGVIPQEFNVRQSLSEIYSCLGEKDFQSTSTFQNGSNNIIYAYFQLAKILQINPVILMLTQGVLPAWKLLDSSYYIIQNQENKWIHPILILELILSFQALPTLIKEIFTEVEWFRLTSQIICDAKVLKNKGQAPYELVDFLDYSEFDQMVELDKQLKRQLFTEQLHSVEQFQDFAQLIHFDKNIVDQIGLTTAEIHQAQSAILADSVILFGSEEPDYTEQCNQIAKLIRSRRPTDPARLTLSFEEAVDLTIQDPDLRIKIKMLKPQIRYRAMMKVYQETTKLFVDPRFEDQQKIQTFSEQYFMSKLPYEEIGIFSLGVCTTITQLRSAYWNVAENIVPREEDHYKIVAGQVDYVLTSIDRLFHFKNCMDFFCKQRAATLIGLATGFAFTADHFIQANCTSSLVTYERANELYKMMETPYDLQKRKIQFKWKYLSTIMYYRNQNTKRDSKLFKLYNYKTILKYGLDIYTDPENYIEFAIQSQTQLEREDKGYDWKQYFFDASYVPLETSLAQLSRLEGQETKYRGIQLSDRQMQLFQWAKMNCQYQINNLIQKIQIQQVQLQSSDLKSKIQSSSQQASNEPQMNLETIFDVRSGRKWTEVYASQERWSVICYQYTDNFRLLIDILKGHYQSICEPDTYFTDEEPQAALAYSGLTAISGSFYKVKYGWNQNTSLDLSRYLNNCCWNTSSNKKNLQELLSIYFRCFEGLNALSLTMLQDSLLVNSLVALSCQLSNNEQSKYDHLGNLINVMDLSENDSAVLKRLIRAYLGEVDQYYQLAQFSTLITPIKVQRFNPVQIGKLIKNKRKLKQVDQLEKTINQPQAQQIQQQTSNEIDNQAQSEIESQYQQLQTQTSDNTITIQTQIQQQHSQSAIEIKQQSQRYDQNLSTTAQQQQSVNQQLNNQQGLPTYEKVIRHVDNQEIVEYIPIEQGQQYNQQSFQQLDSPQRVYQPVIYQPVTRHVDNQEIVEYIPIEQGQQYNQQSFQQLDSPQRVYQPVIYQPVTRYVDNQEIVEYIPIEQGQQYNQQSFQQLDSPQRVYQPVIYQPVTRYVDNQEIVEYIPIEQGQQQNQQSFQQLDSPQRVYQPVIYQPVTRYVDNQEIVEYIPIEQGQQQNQQSFQQLDSPQRVYQPVIYQPVTRYVDNQEIVEYIPIEQGQQYNQQSFQQLDSPQRVYQPVIYQPVTRYVDNQEIIEYIPIFQDQSQQQQQSQQSQFQPNSPKIQQEQNYQTNSFVNQPQFEGQTQYLVSNFEQNRQIYLNQLNLMEQQYQLKIQNLKVNKVRIEDEYSRLLAYFQSNIADMEQNYRNLQGDFTKSIEQMQLGFQVKQQELMMRIQGLEQQIQEEQQNLDGQQAKQQLEILDSLKQQYGQTLQEFNVKEKLAYEEFSKIEKDFYLKREQTAGEIRQLKISFCERIDQIERETQLYENDYMKSIVQYREQQEYLLNMQLQEEKLYQQEKEAINKHMEKLKEQFLDLDSHLKQDMANLEDDYSRQQENLNNEFLKQEEKYQQELQSFLKTLDEKEKQLQNQQLKLDDQIKETREQEINSLKEQLNQFDQDYKDKKAQFLEVKNQAEKDFSLKQQWFLEQAQNQEQQFKNQINLIQRSQQQYDFEFQNKQEYYREQILRATNQQQESKFRERTVRAKKQSKNYGQGVSSIPPVSPIKYRKGNIKQAFKAKKNTQFMETSNTGDMYYSVPKILNKLLYGLDQSQLHKLDKIDPNRFNFCKYSALTLDQNKTENQFLILLWQLAQAATKSTLPDNCKLPIVTESELASDNQNSKEFKKNYDYIWPRCQFMVQVMNDDYSFFFKNPENSKNILTDFSILRKDQVNGDLNFLKAMIGLKSNKMQIIQNKVRKNRESKKKPVDISGLDLQEQVNNLYDSKIINIQVENQTQEFNEKLSKSIAQLFLAISSGNIDQIVQSLMERDSMSACFVLSLFLWKNITPILSKPDLIYNLDTQKMVLPAIQFLPLLIYSQIIDQQDKILGMPNLADIKVIISSMQRIIELITVNKLSQQFYDELEQIQQLQRKQQQQFQWSIWIMYIPEFLTIFRQFAKKEKLYGYGPSEYIFKLITGYYFFEKIQSTKFIGPLMQLYVQCNKLINYPDSLKSQKINLKQMIPPTMISLMDFLPNKLKTYVQIFDKFLQLFIFIQIPSKSMKLLKQYSQNQTSNSYNLQTIVEKNEDGIQRQIEESNFPQPENQQSEGDSTDAEIKQIITGFILDIIGQTFNGLWNTFRDENQKELSVRIHDLTNWINDTKSRNKQVSNSAMQGDFCEYCDQMQQQLEDLLQSQKYFDDSMNQIKRTTRGIIILLTGYDINDRSTTATKELKSAILCYILDLLLFSRLGLLQYINTSVIREIYNDIHDVTNQPFKSISNPDFMKSLIQLIYTITGQQLSEEFKLRKSKMAGLIIEDMSSSIRKSWYVELPVRIPIVELPVNIISSIFQIATGKVEGISLLLKELKVGEGVIRIVDNIIQQVNDIGVFQGKPVLVGQSTINSKKSQEMQELMKKVKEGAATSADIFKAVDEDGTNSISKEEFGILAKRLGMKLSEHRINEIFASIKKNTSKNDTLNEIEFAKATTYLQQKNTFMALDFLGISPALLTLSLVMLAIILLLIFIFIFLGIQAFALGGTFGAIINSILPMAAGSGAGSKIEKLGDKGKRDTTIGDSVEKTQKIIQSDQI